MAGERAFGQLDGHRVVRVWAVGSVVSIGATQPGPLRVAGVDISAAGVSGHSLFWASKGWKPKLF